jgi:outer membrane protein assembly factor BamB
MFKRKMVSILVLLCAARTARANDWTGIGSDPQLSRRSAEQSDPSFTSSWSYSLGTGNIIATPVTADGRIVTASSNGTVAALDAATGKLLWSRALQAGVRATPAIANDQVAIPTMGGALFSLDLADGAVLWQRAFGGQNYSSPLVVPAASPADADTLVVGAGFPQQDVWRFNALTGEPMWHTAKNTIAGIIYSSPVLADKRVVVGMNGGRFQSLDLASGAIDWKLDAAGDVYLSSPLVVGDHLYAFPGDAAASLFAVDINSGNPVPGFPVSIPDPAPVAGAQTLGRGPAISSPMTAGGLVIVQLRRNDILPSKLSPAPVSMREYVVAIDPILGQVRWQYLVAGRTADNTNDVPQLQLCATPAGFSNQAGSFVAVSSSVTGRVVVLDVRTGQERWSSQLSSAGRSSPVFSNGQLLVATDDGVLHAFSSSSNRAPSAPSQIGPADGEITLSATGAHIEWTGAADPEGSALSYLVRLDDAGGTRIETQTAAGQANVTLMLKANTNYIVAVRSRDPQGALSPWSTPRRLHVGDAPSQPQTQQAPPASPSPASSHFSGTDFVSILPDMPAAAPADVTTPPQDYASPPPAQTPAASLPPCTPATSAKNTTATSTDTATATAATTMTNTTAPGTTAMGAATPTSAPELAGNPAVSAPAGTAQVLSTLATTSRAAPAPQTELATAAAPNADDHDGLADRGGCSVSSGRGAGHGSVLLLGLLAVVARSRARRAAAVRP